MDLSLNILLSMLCLAASLQNGINTFKSVKGYKYAFRVHSKTMLNQYKSNNHQNQSHRSLQTVNHKVNKLKTMLSEPVYVAAFFTKGEVLVITALHATGNTVIAIGLILGKVCSEKMCEGFPNWRKNVFIKTLPYFSMVSATSTVQHILSLQIDTLLVVAFEGSNIVFF